MNLVHIFWHPFVKNLYRNRVCLQSSEHFARPKLRKLPMAATGSARMAAVVPGKYTSMRQKVKQLREIQTHLDQILMKIKEFSPQHWQAPR